MFYVFPANATNRSKRKYNAYVCYRRLSVKLHIIKKIAAGPPWVAPMMGLKDGTSGRGPMSAVSAVVVETATGGQTPHIVRVGAGS